ncbi:MAG TPA: hypothetical protein ENN22_16780, partial [bacterium]|nr:hypothetical protein [bacterium]
MQLSRFFKTISTIALLVSQSLVIYAAEVYLVLGSDTAIWQGMNVRQHDCYYNIDLYVNPAANTYQVMDPMFRAQFKDSYGTPLKMTWWMMAGNIFRYARNNNVPIPNIMTLYLMKKYHGDNIAVIGDELSLHYHTFFWSDYDGDGMYYWNQSLTFMECFDDFNYTLAQFLLDEQLFPVSFRSGWHYMDNDWQNYLDERVLPYSMHNAYPSKRTDLTEPLDNTYDWSMAPAEFVPYNPSPENYQIPGDGPGWNVRSAHFNRTRYANLMDSVFIAANNGKDQVACFWGHLPETDFLTNIEILDSLAQKMSTRYPDVKFRYCTAIEAMQRWRQSNDDQAPNLIINEEEVGDKVRFRIQTDEPIFQTQPFVAVKDIYEQYYVAECVAIGTNEWRTTDLFTKAHLAKVGVAVCDTMGNQSLEFINYLPNDVFIDNLDDGYQEISGEWTTMAANAWGVDSRICQLAQQDSAKVRWSAVIEQSTYYNVFIQVPEIQNPAENILFSFYQNDQLADTIRFSSPLPSMEWIYLRTLNLQQFDQIAVEMSAQGAKQPGKTIAADVVKISALVKQRAIYIHEKFIDLGPVSVEDTISYTLQIMNQGIEELRIYGIASGSQNVSSAMEFPVTAPPMGAIDVPLIFYASTIGSVLDTLTVSSDDPLTPTVKIPIHADVQNYFRIIDNEDSLLYEEFGQWHYSVAWAWGTTSRYAWLNATPKAYARFNVRLAKSGYYEIFEIVPKTENASNYALYEITIDHVVSDSIYIDQNQGSGQWVSLGRHYIPADVDLSVRVVDTGQSTAGHVLRADAIKIALIEESTIVDDLMEQRIPTRFALQQNFPNPFNPDTEIRYQLPETTPVKLEIYNLLGQKIRTLIDAQQPAGSHTIRWD